MKKKDSSSWSEIKSLDERLARDPDSFCFARLSEIYLKVGLVADSLNTARKGVAKHPGYLAGQRALAMACNANGLHEESRRLLEKVTAAVPEDTAAQKLLATLYVEAGDAVSAMRAYSTLLDFRPEDVQSRKRLEELQAAAPGGAVPSVAHPGPAAGTDMFTADAEEDVYELSEDDIIHDEDETSLIEEEEASFMEEEQTPAVEEVETSFMEEEASSAEEEETMFMEEPPAAAVAAAPVAEHHDPLSTLTLAELYEQQGFAAKALAIYRTILADDPANPQLQAKVASLEQQASAAETPITQPDAAEIEEEMETFVSAGFDEPAPVVETPAMAAPVLEEVTFAEPEPFASAAFEDMPAPVEAKGFSSLANTQSDEVVGTLDRWLENIRRIKACR